MDGYCSDITRTVFTGPPPAEFVELYELLAGRPGGRRWRRPGSAPRARRSTPPPGASSPTGGYGDAFIHRTGHGIGLEEHEDPYIVAGNTAALVPGHAFSVEPGIYLAGRFGARIEDIVVASVDGPLALNRGRPRPDRRRRLAGLLRLAFDICSAPATRFRGFSAALFKAPDSGSLA